MAVAIDVDTKEALRIGFVSLGDADDITTWSGVPYHVLRELRRKVQVETCFLVDRNLKTLLLPARIAARLESRNVILDHYPIVLRQYGFRRVLYWERSADLLISLCKQAISGKARSASILG